MKFISLEKEKTVFFKFSSLGCVDRDKRFFDFVVFGEEENRKFILSLFNQNEEVSTKSEKFKKKIFHQKKLLVFHRFEIQVYFEKHSLKKLEKSYLFQFLKEIWLHRLLMLW